MSVHLTINNRQLRSGFTLVELLVVIAIISFLVAAATYSWTNAQQKGRDGRRKADLKAVQQTLELYFQTWGKYPAAGTGADAGKIACNTGTNPTTNGDNTAKAWGAVFSCDPDGTAGTQTAVIYMQQLPKDPVGPSGRPEYFYSTSSNTTYKLNASLENANDPDINPPSNLPCTADSGYNYCVIQP